MLPRTFFVLSDLIPPLFFVNVPTKFFPSGVTPLEGVIRGGPPLPAPGDTTVKATVANVGQELTAEITAITQRNKGNILSTGNFGGNKHSEHNYNFAKVIFLVFELDHLVTELARTLWVGILRIYRTINS